MLFEVCMALRMSKFRCSLSRGSAAGRKIAEEGVLHSVHIVGNTVICQHAR